MHVIDIQKKILGPTPSLGTPNIMFDVEELEFFTDVLFLITQISLKPALYDTSEAIMQKHTYQYAMIVLNEFDKSRYTEIVLCLLSNDK